MGYNVRQYGVKRRGGGLTSIAIPGTNIVTARAWKNLRRMLRLACTRFSSLACSTPNRGPSDPCFESAPLLLLIADAPFLILILLARTSLVCHPPTATTTVPIQYATRMIRFHRCQPVNVGETDTPSLP